MVGHLDAEPERVDPATPFRAGRWRGQWIWGPRTAVRAWGGQAIEATLDPARFDQWVLFRRTFELDDVPAEAPFRLTADSRYILWVNEELMARGPLRHGPRRLRYDT